MAFIERKIYSPRNLIALIVLFLFVGLTVYSSQKKQDIRQNAAAPTETIAPKIISTNWNWPPTQEGYYRFEWQVTPLLDPTPAGYSWSHFFLFKGGGLGDAGLQSQGNRYGNASVGKIASFSIWTANVSEGTTCGKNEGIGQRCIVAYEWVKNRIYKFKIAKISSDAGGTWWGSWVTDTVTQSETFIGKIQAPLESGGLDDWSGMWTEYISPPITNCSQLVHSSVKFTNPVANGNIAPVTHSNYISSQEKCPGSSIKDVLEGVQQDMGDLSNLTPFPTVLPFATSTPGPIPTASEVFPTSIPDPLSTPDPDPDMDPNQPSTQLTITAFFPGIGPGYNSNPLHLTRTIVVGVYNTNNKLVRTGNGFLKYDQKGFFRGKVDIGAIANGTHYVKIISQNTLVTLIEPQFQTIRYDQENILPSTRLYIGDYNSDLRIDINDYKLALICFQNKKCPIANEIDINDDGKTDVIDYNLFIGSFKSYEGD